MFLEFFKYISNPVSKTAKQLGHLHEIIGMEARSKRLVKQWSSHLQNTKTIIEKSSREIPHPNEVIVLGSGLLLDVPIELLAEHFTHVYLVDVVHLNKVKKMVKKFSNVELVEHDVTGFSEKLEKITATETYFEASIPCLSSNTSLVISTNMLSQIAFIIGNYAKNKLAFNKEQLDDLARKVVQDHINMLLKVSTKVCLISDIERTYHDEQKHLKERMNVIMDVSLPKPDETWSWNLAPKGEMETHISIDGLVYAYENFACVKNND